MLADPVPLHELLLLHGPSGPVLRGGTWGRQEKPGWHLRSTYRAEDRPPPRHLLHGSIFHRCRRRVQPATQRCHRSPLRSLCGKRSLARAASRCLASRAGSAAALSRVAATFVSVMQTVYCSIRQLVQHQLAMCRTIALSRGSLGNGVGRHRGRSRCSRGPGLVRATISAAGPPPEQRSRPPRWRASCIVRGMGGSAGIAVTPLKRRWLNQDSRCA